MRVPLPFELELDTDYLDRRRAIGSGLLVGALVIGIVAAQVLAPRPKVPLIHVELASAPAGALVSVGGERAARGATPLSLDLPRFSELTLTLEGYIPYVVRFGGDATYTAQLLHGKEGRPSLWHVQHTIPSAQEQLEETRFSPDGRRIGYRVGTQRWSYDLVEQTYSRVDTLEFLGGGGVFSPDGRWLVRIDRSATGRHTLHLVDLTARSDEVVLESSLRDSGPLNDVAWAPDGRSVLLAYGRGRDGRSRLARFDPFAPATPAVIAAVPAVIAGGPFAFSPDGSRVSFFLDVGHPVLAYVDLRDGSTLRQIADLALTSEGGRTSATLFANPSVWSTDGQLLYFIAPQAGDVPTGSDRYVRNGGLTLWVTDLVHPPKLVSTAQSPTGDPVYAVSRAGDSSLLTLYRAADGLTSLYRIVPEQNSWALLQTFRFALDENAQVLFSPSGASFIVFIFRATGLDRWVYFEEP